MFQFNPSRPDCQDVLPQLSPYLDGHLPSVDAERVRTHVAGCSQCAEELESLRSTVELLRALPQMPTPRSFTLMVPRDSSPARFMFYLRTATAAVAMSLIVVLMLMVALPNSTSPTSTNLAAPNGRATTQEASRAAETSSTGLSDRGTVLPEGKLSVEAVPTPLPTSTPEKGLVFQLASAPLEEQVVEPTKVDPVAIVPTAAPTAVVVEAPVSEPPAPASMSLHHIAYGLTAALIGLGGVTAAAWWRERRVG